MPFQLGVMIHLRVCWMRLLGFVALYAASSVFICEQAVSTAKAEDPTLSNSPKSFATGDADARLSTLHVLAIGISDYEDAGYRLQVANDDARALADAFAGQRGKLFAEVRPVVLTDRQATKNNILKALRNLQESVTQYDFAVITLAGHGVADDQDEYFFLPCNYDPRQELESTGISWDDFRRRLGRLPCTVWLVLDTCHSGLVTRGQLRGLSPLDVERATDQALRKYLASERGVIVTAAALGKQKAAERADWKHGALTLALLEGLSGKWMFEEGQVVPFPHQVGSDNVVDLEELSFFVSHRVRLLTGGAQAVITNHTGDLSLGQVPVGVVDPKTESAPPPEPPGAERTTPAPDDFASAWSQTLDEIANEIAQYLRERSEPRLAVGPIVASGGQQQGSETSVRKNLLEALDRRLIAVREKAPWTLLVDYNATRDARDESFVAIDAWLEDEQKMLVFRTGRKVPLSPPPVASSRAVEREATAPPAGAGSVAAISTLFGITAELPPDKSSSFRRNLLVTAMARPQPHLEDHSVSARAGSPYRVQVLCDGAARPPMTERDGAFVELQRGEEYAVKLINKSSRDAAVTLAIDGINVFAFSEEPATHFLVPARGELVVPGWHRNNRISDAFLITEFSQSMAGRSLPQDSAQVGAITAAFAAAWDPDQPPPADEADFDRGRGQDATGRGRPLEVEYQQVRRAIGAVRATVSVRYRRPASDEIDKDHGP